MKSNLIFLVLCMAVVIPCHARPCKTIEQTCSGNNGRVKKLGGIGPQKGLLRPSGIQTIEKSVTIDRASLVEYIRLLKWAEERRAAEEAKKSAGN